MPLARGESDAGYRRIIQRIDILSDGWLCALGDKRVSQPDNL
jgi:hypothetical protein